jgi:ubiquinone/menaquinone biosynthesis C-methylase UbiE
MATMTETWAPVAGGRRDAELGLVDRARYLAQQQGLAALLSTYVRIGQRFVAEKTAPPPKEALDLIESRFQELLHRDLANVESGFYPKDLLFQFPLREYARAYPHTVRDVFRVIRRIQRRNFTDLPPDIDLSAYPAYYRRNFHWQTDGWLSERSARIYDVNVEILFGGTADIMRRMAIPPLVSALRGQPRARLLDVACGTGRFLLQANRALPQVKLYGLDLSPYYLRHARKVLRGIADVSLVAENAESMPFQDGFFDAVSSVFLFHELPKQARRNVLREVHRVLKPGGTVVVCDSAQLEESRPIAHYLRFFAALLQGVHRRSTRAFAVRMRVRGELVRSAVPEQGRGGEEARLSSARDFAATW